MFGRETRMLLRHYLEQGSSKSELARQLGVSRDTIHRWIRDGDLERDVDAEAVRYGPRPLVATKLDAYKPIIDARLTAYPELSSVRLLDEIRAAGYAGGYSQLKAYVRRVRPLPAPEPVIRFETPAGRQAQVDFARFRFDWGVRYALLVVLGYSRVLWCRFYPRQDMATLMDGLEEAFGSFRWRPAGAALRSDESGDYARPAARGRRAGPQCGVSPLRASLGLHAARLPPVSRADEGQGRASRAVPARQFRLRPHVPPRCGSRSPATALARPRRQCARARHDARASAGPLRSRGAVPPAAGGHTTLHLADRRAAIAHDPDPSIAAGGRDGREALTRRVCAPGRRCRMKSAPLSRRDRLRHILADLRMPGALEALDAILHGVDGGTLTAPEGDRAAARRADSAAQ